MRSALICARMMPLNDNILSAMQSDEAEQDALAGRSPKEEEEGPEANTAGSQEDTDETFEAQVCLSLTVLSCRPDICMPLDVIIYAIINCCICHYMSAHALHSAQSQRRAAFCSDCIAAA